MKHKKRALFQSVISLILCLSMLVGTTFAWFTDSVSSTGNIIQSGNLKIGMKWSADLENPDWQDASKDAIFDYSNWEPGYTDLKYLQISNDGNLAFQYQLTIEEGTTPNNGAAADDGTPDETQGIILDGGEVLDIDEFDGAEDDDADIIADGGSVTPGATVSNAMKLAEVIDVYYLDATDKNFSRQDAMEQMKRLGTLADLIRTQKAAAQGVLLPVPSLFSGDAEPPSTMTTHTGSTTAAIMLKMREDAGNAYMGLSPENGYCVKVYATQYSYEADSFGSDYDSAVALPGFSGSISGTTSVETDANGLTIEEVSLGGETGGATVPAGVQVEEGTTELSLAITKKESSDSGVEKSDNEELIPLDIHITGVSPNNTIPIQVNLGKILPEGMNIGNVTLYHVEGTGTNSMTQVFSLDELDVHNEFYYDPATGNVIVSMATFSEVALLSDKEAIWEGKIAENFAGGTGTEADPYIIANADQFLYFGDLISNANDTYGSAHYKLIADINLGGEENANNGILFYPIGYHKVGGEIETAAFDDAPEAAYIIEEDTKSPASAAAVADAVWYTYGGAFQGTFDGAGHTISNIYQNTWSMDGDYDNGYWNEAMGLFGYVYDGTIKNLTVHNFQSDGEFTPTGVIAAYAANSTFENIAITDCNPRVYNTGNGGIVGIGGNSSDTSDKTLTFKNITIDNSNKISALWGSWDVACGGLVGMFRGAGHVYMTNCHVAAQIDVFNDVCGNYQYYWYRYSGMMIGTNKNMVTDEAGYTVPETSKFHAEGCTVHFGEWNDYYYCELVANTLASYTHDHQFSRLEEIDSLDKIKSGDTWTKTGNFLLINGDTKTCYHIVKNEDGMLKQHLHTDAGTEVVNGITVQKEDKQIVYLPFNQLFTGYGWGVKHIPIYDDGTGFEGITILGRDEANSVVKFISNVGKELYSEKTYSLSEIFAENGTETADVPVMDTAVTVTVTNLDENNPVSAEIVDDKTNWENGTITFTGKGDIKITIQDYYFCSPTTIEVKIVEHQPAEKFKTKFTGDFLYRVGNENAITLDSLFESIDDVESGTVAVEIERLSEKRTSAQVTGEYTENADWKKGTIKFEGTGVVKISIKDEDPYCKATELVLEVVDAKNITSKTDATDTNVVLLNDISGGFIVSNGHAFYGNKFTVTCSGDGSYRSAAVSYGFVTVENGGVLDNTRIICDIFPESYAYTTEMKADTDGRYPYGYSAVVVSGNSKISNCYIEGARNNIQVGEGNVTIENTEVAFGSLSNIHVKSNNAYTVTLNNIITKQEIRTSEYDTSKKVYGFGILVGTNESDSNAELKLKGKLIQDNWIAESDAEEISNKYAKKAIDLAFGYAGYKHNGQINTGIAYLNQKTAMISDERENKETVHYELNEITMSGYTGQVYSIVNGQVSQGDIDTGNTDILPSISFVGNNQYVTCTSAYNGTAWVTKVSVDLDNISGGSYNFSFKDLKVQKYGLELKYTVKDADGKNVNAETPISLNQLMSYDYTLVVEDNQIYNNEGELIEKTVTREIPFILSATKTSIEPPKFTNAGTATAIRLVDKAGGDWRPAYTVLTGVTVTYWSASESKVKTVDLSTLYNSGNISSNAWTYTCADYTLTITGGQVHSDGSKITPVVSNSTLYFASTNKAFTTGTTSRSIILTYVFTDKNDSATWDRTETVTYSNLSEYDYSKFKSGTLEAPSSSSGGSCLAEGTMMTMADGSKRAIEDLRKGDMVMSYDHMTGKITSSEVIIVVKTGSEFYENTIVFDDGTKLVTINEHGIYDLNLNKYVNIDHENAEEFIGHNFVAVDTKGKISTKKLVRVDSKFTSGYKYDIVTNQTLNYVAEDTLSITHVLVDVINSFDFDGNMRYDQKKMQEDIAKYGLYTYNEWDEYCDISVFEEYNIPVMKVGISKGMYTKDYIIDLINTFVLDESVQIID